MHLSRIHLINFRLFSDSVFDLEETSLITGKNGSGKTSLLEAVHVLLKSRSFRTSSMNSLINHNQDNFILNAKLEGKLLTFEEEINIWTKLLVDEAEKITKNREKIFNKVTAKVPEFFNKLPLDERWKKIASQLSFKFFKGWDQGELIEVLRSNFQDDMKRGFTKFGPQRFDLEINILKNKAGDVLSRGEQKLLILLTFLCFGEFISEYTEKNVFYLIDDAAAEFDEENLFLALTSLEKVKGQKIISSIKKPENIKLNNVIDL